MSKPAPGGSLDPLFYCLYRSERRPLTESVSKVGTVIFAQSTKGRSHFDVWREGVDRIFHSTHPTHNPIDSHATPSTHNPTLGHTFHHSSTTDCQRISTLFLLQTHLCTPIQIEACAHAAMSAMWGSTRRKPSMTRGYRERFPMSGLKKEDLKKGLEEIFPDCPSLTFDVKHVSATQAVS